MLTKNNRIGVLLIVAVLFVIALVYYFTVERPSGAQGDFTNNPIVERRVKNLQNSR